MPIDPLATRFNPPFALEAAPVFWMINPYTESIIDDLQRNPRFKNLAVAVIDLTGRTRRTDGAGWITFSGWNMYDQRFAASLVKIAALFAAFRLRENLRIAANQVSAKDKKEVFKTVAVDWKGVVETAVPDGKPDFPKFDQIFTINGSTGAWAIDFTTDYLNHLKNMIGHSNNHSASVCIDRIGFQYLNGALETDGLYSREFGGLWLGGNYAGRNWMREPRTRLTHMGATAKAVAAFLTLLEDSRLVSPEASDEMRAIMRLAGSWFAEGLDRARPPRPITDIYAKVGLMGTHHDCAVIERSANGKRIRYAAVVLGASSAQIIRDLAVKLDDYIIAAN
jgi:Beta-lactamase enzyme family